MSESLPTAQVSASSPGISLPEEVPVLILMYHPEAKFQGRRRPITDNEALLLGRGQECMGKGAMDEERLSRRHALVTREKRKVVVADQESRNGSTVNGLPIDEAQLYQGDVLGIGGLLFLYHWQSPNHIPPQHPRLVGDSAALARVIRRLGRMGTGNEAVLVWGEEGTGKQHICQELHRLGRQGRPFGVLDCSSGREPPWERILGKVRDGTLVMLSIDRAPQALQQKILTALQPSGDQDPLAARLLFTVDAATRRELLERPLEPELLELLDTQNVRAPALRERPDDILPLARHIARSRSGEPRRLSPRLALMLLRYGWPDNVRELTEVIHRLVDEQPDDPMLLAPRWLAKKVWG